MKSLKLKTMITVTVMLFSLLFALTACYKEAPLTEEADGTISVIFSVEAFVLGKGWVIAPIELELTKSSNDGNRASEVFDSAVRESGLAYTKRGTLGSDFYLVSFDVGFAFHDDVAIPSVLGDYLAGYELPDIYDGNGSLGENDYGLFFTGWFFTVNDVFMDVGTGDYYLQDGDVMRVQFSFLWGSDINSGGFWFGDDGFSMDNGEPPYIAARKDALTKLVAAVNSRDKYKELQSTQEYKNALDLLCKLDATQAQIDAAFAALEQVIDGIK